MDPFVDQLASLCRAHVTRAKWVFVPAHSIGRTLGERLALGGANWLNLRFVTPLDIALRMGAPFLVERGIDPSEEGLGPALMMRLMLELRGDGGYFRPLADQPTLARALWSTVRELRMAGVTSAGLKPHGFASPEKHAELAALLASYERFLDANHRGDMAVVYEEATRHQDWCPVQDADCWTELPDVTWTALQRRLIDSMPGERIVPKALELPGTDVPRRLRGAKTERIRPDAADNALAFLLAPARREAAIGDREPRRLQEPRLALFHAGGREAEIEEVFRRILAAGQPLDSSEIACASDAHVALIWEKAMRLGWPITLGSGVPATATRPGRALIGLCDWIETDFSATHLRRLLQSGDLGIEETDEGFTAGQAARMLARAEAGWGRDTYALSLGVLQKGYETRAKDPDLAADEREAAGKKAALAATIARWITRLIAAIPEESSSKVPLQQVVDATLAFLDRTTSRASQLDHRAAGSLADHVTELRALGSFECSLGEALRFIRERVESLQVAPERPRPGHLYACRLQQAGYAGRRNLFVVGLEEGRVFPAAAEDPILLDDERRSISGDLQLSTDRIDEAVFTTLSRLAASGRRGISINSQPPTGVDGIPPSVTLSFSCRDTREFRETYASWLMLQAFRLQQGDAGRTYQQMKGALGEPASCMPVDRAAAITTSGWWLRTVVGTGSSGVHAVESTFTALARGRGAAARRASSSFTEFDGYVPAAGRILDPCAAANAFSVTELESAAGCPYRFFLKRGLGLRPVDDGERDRDVWLDPLTRGSALHDLYAALHRRCRAAGRRPGVAQDGAWLTGLAQQALARFNLEMPPATPEILERESRDFLADVELFLEAECEATGSTPIGFEVSFGRPLGQEDEDLARAEPVEINLGGGLVFRIAGRIDRIDQRGPSSFEVLDYKTGVYWRDDWNGTFNGGRRLQHALYGLAAVELLRARHRNPKVDGATYYFPSHKGCRERRHIPAPPLAKTAAVLGDLRAVIADGTFVHAADVKACKWCDYEAACGRGVHEQAKGKMDDVRLKAFGRLAAHE